MDVVVNDVARSVRQYRTKSLFTDIPTVLHTIRTSMKTRVSTAGYCLTGISKTVVPAAAT